jgi:short-subunit dehydrogenase
MRQRSLHQRRVVITGASSGVGRALAMEMAPYSTRLILVARSEQPLAELTDELIKRGAAATEAVVGDVTDPAVRSRIVERVNELWGGLDILVNNAGISAHARFADSSEATLRKIMEVNFFAAVELTRQSLPMLRMGDDSLVVNVGSVLGHRGAPLNSEYSASKFALRGWSEALRAELSRDAVGVLVVSPGTIDTDFFDHLVARAEPMPWGKQKGISPEVAARQIVRAIRLRRREIYPNWRGRMLVWLNRCCPGLVDRLMSRYG